MPAKRSQEPLTKITLNIFTSDYDRLHYLYNDNFSRFIRHLIRAHLTRTDAAIAAEGEKLVNEINIDV